jgi:hypothetical protein
VFVTVDAVVIVGVIAEAANYLAQLHARPESARSSKSICEGKGLCHSFLLHVGLSVLADNLRFRGLNDIILKTDIVLLLMLFLYYNSNALRVPA